MLTAVVVFLRTIGLICAGHRAVALENLALRQQLAALKRSGRRPQLRTRDRVFWILLANAWRDWRKALVFVQPDTVVRWHRQWLRRRWAARSRPSRRGRPSTDVALRTLVAKMTAANPLWGAPRIHGELQKLGVADLGAHGLTDCSVGRAGTFSNVANVSRESCGRPGLDGLLHGPDRHRPRALRLRRRCTNADASSIST